MQSFRVTAVPRDNGTCTLIVRGELDLATAPDVDRLGTAALTHSQIHTILIDGPTGAPVASSSRKGASNSDGMWARLRRGLFGVARPTYEDRETAS